MRALSYGLLFALSGCSLILDSDEHRGGHDEPARDAAVEDAGPMDAAADDAGPTDAATEDDAGPDASVECDRDGDGVPGPQCGGSDCDDDDPLRYPGAQPICANGTLEHCPSDPPILPLDLFSGVARQGRLAEVTLASGGMLEEFAFAAFSGEDFYGGLEVVFGERVEGESDYLPVRILATLSAPSEAASAPLGNAISETTRVSSISATRGPDQEFCLGMTLEGERYYYGCYDGLVSDPGYTMRTEEDALVKDGIAIFGRRYDDAIFHVRALRRTPFFLDPEAPPGMTALLWEVFAQGSDQGWADEGVPQGAVRALAIDDGGSNLSGILGLQDGLGSLWLYRVGVGGYVVSHVSLAGQVGKLAMIRRADSNHTIAYYDATAARFVFARATCAASNPADPEPGICPVDGLVGGQSWPWAPAGPEGGEIPAALRLDDGRTVFAAIRRYEDGDEVALLTLNAAGTALLTSAPIVTHSTRGTGERVKDVKMDRVSSGVAHHLVVLATLGDEEGASRLVLGGLRACLVD